jgi:hypothetical protein
MFEILCFIVETKIQGVLFNRREPLEADGALQLVFVSLSSFICLLASKSYGSKLSQI